jgi:hypothetical protein
MIYEGCLDSNPEYCRSKLARYRLSHPSLLNHIHYHHKISRYRWIGHPPQDPTSFQHSQTIHIKGTVSRDGYLFEGIFLCMR